MSAATPLDPPEAVRRFNRFYTARIGALGVGHLGTPFSLTEARILFELGGRGRATSAALVQALELDPAQVSRTVARLERAGLVSRVQSTNDGRARLLRPTPAPCSNHSGPTRRRGYWRPCVRSKKSWRRDHARRPR